MTQHLVRLRTSDGETVAFDCAEDETVVAAAARADLAIPTLCGEGNCGTCLGICDDGAFVLGQHNPEALSTNAKARRETLLCRTFPRGELSISVSFPRGALNSVVSVRTAEVIAVDAIGGNTRRLRLRLQPDEDDNRAAEFEPGQFMELTTPDGQVTRAYSLANSPNWSGDLEFLIRLQPGGQFSGWLETKAALGQVVSVRGPLGTFTLQETGLKPRWFVGGGTGLAPLLSMLRRMAEWQEPHPTRLYLGVNSEAELFAEDEIMEIQGTLPALKIEICIWKPAKDWSGFVGTPVDALRRDLGADGPKPDLYLCGPPALITRAEECALVHGVPAGSIFAERFLPS